jgi:hypothetical protein
MSNGLVRTARAPSSRAAAVTSGVPNAVMMMTAAAGATLRIFLRRPRSLESGSRKSKRITSGSGMSASARSADAPSCASVMPKPAALSVSAMHQRISGSSSTTRICCAKTGLPMPPTLQDSSRHDTAWPRGSRAPAVLRIPRGSEISHGGSSSGPAAPLRRGTFLPSRLWHTFRQARAGSDT